MRIAKISSLLLWPLCLLVSLLEDTPLCSAQIADSALNLLESGLGPLAITITRKKRRLSRVIVICRRKASTATGVRGTSATPFGVFDPDDRVVKVHLVLFHRSQLYIDSQTCFRIRRDLKEVAAWVFADHSSLRSLGYRHDRSV